MDNKYRHIEAGPPGDPGGPNEIAVDITCGATQSAATRPPSKEIATYSDGLL
jgi:hypothetical protein